MTQDSHSHANFCTLCDGTFLDKHTNQMTQQTYLSVFESSDEALFWHLGFWWIWLNNPCSDCKLKKGLDFKKTGKRQSNKWTEDKKKEFKVLRQIEKQMPGLFMVKNANLYECTHTIQRHFSLLFWKTQTQP